MSLIIKMDTIKTEEHLRKSIPYIMNERKTDGLCFSNAGITPEQILDTFFLTKQMHPTHGTRQGYHFKFSFSKDETIAPEDALSFIREWVEEYLGDRYDYACSVHKDRDHMHMHLVFNSVAKTIVTADRGYESYNNMAHIQEKGWFYLIRVKDFGKYKTGILHGLDLPDTEEFDEYIDLNLTRKQTNEMKNLLQQKNTYRWISHKCTFDYLPSKSKKSDPAVLYHLPFRIVRFPISDNSYEVVVTNLDAVEFPSDELKKLYGMRWGIETSFRDLKYTIGLLHFHSKKVDYILQEIFAGLIMYNFSELITSHVVIEKGSRKYEYKINFSVAVHICRDFLLSINNPPDVELLIARYVLPIRPGRSRPREMKVKQAISFMYRIA